MIFIISHLGKTDDGERFAIVHQSKGKMADETILVGPETIKVKNFPNSNLRRDLIWYLEEFLDYPFSPKIETANDVIDALRGWGADCFKKLFNCNIAARWYRDACADAIKELSIKIASDDPVVLSWPWEALFDEDEGKFLANNASIERQLGGTFLDPPIPLERFCEDRLNILLIIARPMGVQDVRYHAVSRPMIEMAQKNPWMRVDVLRPPTFDALRIKMEEKPGFYHIVHFDGHGGGGESTTDASLCTHKQNLQGQLVFEDEDGDADPILADRLSNLFSCHRISFMVLTACRSASTNGLDDDPFSSIAVSLIRAGIRGVVAMGYNLYVSGAQQFVPAFYHRFIFTGSIVEATRAGREAMATQKARVCARGTFPLEDWMVPVLYQNDAPVLTFLQRKIISKTEESVAVPDKEMVGDGFSFIGRDWAFLTLERALRHQLQGAILIHGMAGIGKTALVYGFLSWYSRTGGLEFPPILFSCDSINSGEDVINRLVEELFINNTTSMSLGEKFKAVLNVLMKNRRLIVFDGFEYLSGIENTIVPIFLLDDNRKFLRRLIRILSKGKSKIIISSRSPEQWLSDSECYRLPLGGLIGEEMWCYCNDLLVFFGLTPDREDVMFQRLVGKLDGHPLAMRAILSILKEKNTDQLLEEWENRLNAKQGNKSIWNIYKELMVSINYLSEDFIPVLQLISLHQRFVNIHYIEQMANGMSILLSYSHIVDCFSVLEARGCLHCVGLGIYQMHPSLSGLLIDKYPADSDARRGFIGFMAALLHHYINMGSYEQQSVFQLYGESFHNALYLAFESDLAIEIPILVQGLAVRAYNTRNWLESNRLFTELLSFGQTHGITELIASSYHQLGMVAHAQDNLADAKDLYKKSLEISEHLEYQQGAEHTYHQLGVIAEEQGNWHEAEDFNKKSMNVKESRNDHQGLANSYHQRGVIAQEQGNLCDAEYWYEKSLRISKQQINKQLAAKTYYQLGVISQNKGKFSDAVVRYQHALLIEKSQNNSLGLAQTSHQLGRLYQEQGKLDEADAWYMKALAIFERESDEPGKAASYYQLGILSQNRNNFFEAKNWIIKSQQIFSQLRDMNGFGSSSAQLGVIFHQEGLFLDAAQWYLKGLMAFIFDRDSEKVELSHRNMRGLLAQADPATREKLLALYHKAGLNYWFV